MSAVEHDAGRRQFRTVVDGEAAVLDYQLTGSHMVITHTAVPAAIEGRGVAAELMRAALGIAKLAGWSVTPACSYAAAYMRKHPDDGARHHQEDLLDEALDESYPAGDSPTVGRSS